MPGHFADGAAISFQVSGHRRQSSGNSQVTKTPKRTFYATARMVLTMLSIEPP
jgi:hypothetical protein